jgi:hypothetical protein
MAEMTFRSDSDLIHFLATTTHGENVLGAVAALGRRLHLESTYILVKAYSDGLVEVYGPEWVRARVVLLGRSVTYPEHEIALEKAVEATLPQPYSSGKLIANALRHCDQEIRA